jgi:radical SAM protein with 4Fe4S-binding SPASM domain
VYPKTQLNPYQKILKKTTAKKIPFKCIWEITRKCNLNCQHCYQDKAALKRELTFGEIKKILKILKKEGTLFLTFTGGEPLLREDFFEIANLAKKEGFVLRLLTNATCINESNIREIEKLNLLCCEISLYSMDEKVHDKITQVPSSHKKTLKAIFLLREREIKVIIKVPVMKQNFLSFKKLREFCISEGLPLNYDPVLTVRENGERDPLRFRLNQTEVETIISQDLVPEDDYKGKPQELSFLLREPFCSAAQNGFCIDSQGNLLPCIGIRRPMGNLKTENFQDIWQSKEINIIRNIKIEDLSVCRKCTYLTYCKRCAGCALLEDGDIYGPATASCMLAEAIYKTKHRLQPQITNKQMPITK